jgi:rhamnogalacturonan endolyase
MGGGGAGHAGHHRRSLSTKPLWRIGDWNGTPAGLLNGDKATKMHPSDVRMSNWNPGAYVVGTSTPAKDMPAYHWGQVNAPRAIQFNLTKEQIKDSTVRIGITAAYVGGRPAISLNAWNPRRPPGPSPQPRSRGMTIGTYRCVNTTYTYDVPASALVVGTNTLTASPLSGSSGGGILSPGYSVDCIDMVQRTPQ